MNSTYPSPNELPESFYLSLKNITAIALSGDEQVKYLQGQVTCDVTELTPEKLLNGAHCDAKGKVLSVFRLITHQAQLLLIQPQSSIEQSLIELQKYGVFAKVDIKQANTLSFACLVGSQAQAYIKATANQLPDEMNQVITHQSLSICYIAGDMPRYLIIGEETVVNAFTKKSDLTELNEHVWQLIEINEGIPILTQASVQKYVPQMLNLDKVQGISFTKGCYLGQETVARMQYLGKNKKMMARLVGQSSQSLSDDTIIEKQLGDNWRSAGDVLSYYQANNGECFIQAVVANDLSLESHLRLKDDNNASLILSSLPYLQDSI